MKRPRSIDLSFLRQPGYPGLLGSTFALGMAFSFVAPFLSKWGTEEVGMSSTQFGLFMTVTSLSAMVCSTLLARLSDTRFSRKAMLALGSVCGVLGYSGYALARDPFVLLLIGTSFVAVASVCFAQLFAHVRETAPSGPKAGQSAGFSMSVVRVCFSFSWTMGPAAGAAMLLHFGFRGLFLGAAGLYLLFLVGTLLFVPLNKRRPAPKAEPKESVWRLLGQGDTLASFIAFAVLFGAHAINMMNLPLAVTRSLGGKESDFGIIFGVGPLVEIPLMLWFGHIASKSKGHLLRLLKFGAFVTLAYYLGLYFATAIWHVYLIQILSGISFAILTNVAILFFQDLIPGHAGLATSLFSNAGAVGNLFGFLSFGFVVETFGHQGSFLACAALTAITCVLMLRFRPSDLASSSETLPSGSPAP